MSITIGSNIQSLKAQRQLSNASAALSQSFERLSSGQRINRASDDAAGLAIVNSLNASTRELTTSNRNINDGISALSIIQGALSQQSSIVQRLSELAEQSSSGSYSNTQRQALQTEYTALVAEYARIGDTTTFNGIKLMHGNRSDGVASILIQAGIDGGTASTIATQSVNAGTASGVVSCGNYGAIYNTGINNRDLTFDQLTQLVHGQFKKILGTDNSGNARTFYLAAPQYGQGNAPMLLGFYLAAGQTVTSNSSFTNHYSATDFGSFLSNLLTINSNGVVQGFSSGTSANRTVSDDSGGTITFNLDLEGLRFSGGYGDGAGYVYPDSGPTTAIDFTGVETQTQAQYALDVLSNKRDEIGNTMGTIGAAMSRLLSANQVNGVTKENFSQAESRIRDVDVAAEASEETRLSILQQTSGTVLAHANLQPKIAIQLLQGF